MEAVSGPSAGGGTSIASLGRRGRGDADADSMGYDEVCTFPGCPHGRGDFCRDAPAGVDAGGPTQDVMLWQGVLGRRSSRSVMICLSNDSSEGSMWGDGSSL